MSRRLDRRVAVSAAARALAEPALRGEWTVLFNGVEVDRFANADPWRRPEGRRVVLFVGRHEERKGLSVLLQAMRHLPDDDIEVWIAGEGPETDALQDRHRDDRRLQWLGRIPDAERDSRMAAADAFCSPAIGGESFGVILLEAMAAGAPVVASSIDGYVGVAGELDGDPVAAELPEPGNPRALADALDRVLSDPAHASGLREQGRRRAARFSMEHLAQLYLSMYAELLR
jgi:phosphatidylinositol alpha-mannosyltransferase